MCIFCLSMLYKNHKAWLTSRMICDNFFGSTSARTNWSLLLSLRQVDFDYGFTIYSIHSGQMRVMIVLIQLKWIQLDYDATPLSLSNWDYIKSKKNCWSWNSWLRFILDFYTLCVARVCSECNDEIDTACTLEMTLAWLIVSCSEIVISIHNKFRVQFTVWDTIVRDTKRILHYPHPLPLKSREG